MPYHNFGLGKYVSLGLDISNQESLAAPTNAQLSTLAKIFTHIPVEFRSGPNTIRFKNGESIRATG